MTEDELVRDLARRYDAASGDKVVQIHLFGIERAAPLQGHNLARIAEAATGHSTYGTELRKGMNLAPHVTLNTLF